MRISPLTGKTHGIILDQAANLERLGFPEDIKEYRLPTSREPSAIEVHPTKQCPSCNRLVWGFVMECPECGHVWETEIQDVPVPELVEVLSDHQMQPVERETMIEFFQAQRQISFREGAAPNWARRVFYDRFGFMPEAAWCQGSVFGPKPSPGDKFAYRDYLMAIATRQGKSISWVIEEFQQEFGPEGWQDSFLLP
jgi:hypothetical protein